MLQDASHTEIHAYTTLAEVSEPAQPCNRRLVVPIVVNQPHNLGRLLVHLVEVYRTKGFEIGACRRGSDCQTRRDWAENALSKYIFTDIWSRNCVGLTHMGTYRHADALDSVRLTCEVIPNVQI